MEMTCEKFVDWEMDKEFPFQYPVSSLMLYTVPLPSRNLAVIEEVWTDKDFRNQGRATKLLKQAIVRAKELGATCIELTVREDSPEAQRLYKSLGFQDRSNRAYRLNLK